MKNVEIANQVMNILAKAKVQVVTQETIRPRNEKGHFIAGGAYDRFVLAGHGVSDPLKKTFFKRTKLPKIEALGVKVELMRNRKGSNEVVMKIAA